VGIIPSLFWRNLGVNVENSQTWSPPQTPKLKPPIQPSFDGKPVVFGSVFSQIQKSLKNYINKSKPTSLPTLNLKKLKQIEAVRVRVRVLNKK
jgi:hypothetical protein